MTLRALLLTLSLFFSMHSPLWSATLSKAAQTKLANTIETEYRQRLRVCDTLNWNESDVCEVEAAGQRAIRLAELRADAHPSAKTRYAALMVRVAADYDLAITRCNAVDIEQRSACWQAADTDRQQATDQANSFWGALLH